MTETSFAGMDVDGSGVPLNQELRCWKQLEDEAPDAIEPYARHACVRSQPLAAGSLSCGLGSKSKSLSDPARRPAPNPIWAGGRKTKKIGLGKDPPSLNQNFFSACTFLLCTTIATNHGSLDHRTPANSAGAIRSEDKFEEERLSIKEKEGTDPPTFQQRCLPYTLSPTRRRGECRILPTNAKKGVIG
ncbi:MAG: hypothetical protein IMZ46_14140 [Acidobacteria bacterium]|nr:hypothetical protein [Acidobacteriota bacterium]